jgi:hypothetical protein
MSCVFFLSYFFEEFTNIDSKNVWQNSKQKMMLKYSADIQQLYFCCKDCIYFFNP